MDFPRDIGFASGIASPCGFNHATKRLRSTVHGGDFTMLGIDDDLDWLGTPCGPSLSLWVSQTATELHVEEAGKSERGAVAVKLQACKRRWGELVLTQRNVVLCACIVTIISNGDGGNQKTDSPKLGRCVEWNDG